MIIIHYSTVEGAKLKEEICERCGRKFFYQLHRAATGEVVNILWIDTIKGAGEAARVEAVSQLQKRLASEFDVVSCPNCGHLQRRMVRLLWSYAVKFSLFVCCFFSLPAVVLVAFWAGDFILCKGQLKIALLWFLCSVLLTLSGAVLLWLNPNLAYRLLAGGRR